MRGPAEASVTLVEFADFRCPHCAHMQPVLARVLASYPRDVRLVFVHFPVVSPDSGRAAIAALAAGRQGRFWEMHDFLFELGDRPLDEELLAARAHELGLDVGRFSLDLRSPDLARAVESDLAEAKRLGLRGTPAFFVNGVYLPGTRSFETFRRRIDAELERGAPPPP